MVQQFKALAEQRYTIRKRGHHAFESYPNFNDLSTEPLQENTGRHVSVAIEASKQVGHSPRRRIAQNKHLFVLQADRPPRRVNVGLRTGYRPKASAPTYGDPSANRTSFEDKIIVPFARDHPIREIRASISNRKANTNEGLFIVLHAQDQCVCRTKHRRDHTATRYSKYQTIPLHVTLQHQQCLTWATTATTRYAAVLMSLCLGK